MEDELFAWCCDRVGRDVDVMNWLSFETDVEDIQRCNAVMSEKNDRRNIALSFTSEPEANDMCSMWSVKKSRQQSLET